MNKRPFNEELGGELAGKAVIWGPAIAGAIVAGPVGFAVGAVIGIATIFTGGSGSVPPPDSDPPKK